MTKVTTRPYPGGRPFRQADRDLFFGRADEAAALADLWQSNRLTIAHGPAAAGKTSLLQAGVLPLITDKRFEVLPPGRVSYGVTFPFAGLPEHNPYTLALLRSWAPGESPARLVGLTVSEFIRRRAQRRGAIILAPVDQAEELIDDTGPRWTYRPHFLRELTDALAEPSLHLLLVTREETLGSFTDVLRTGARQHIPALSRPSAAEALTGPAETMGRPFAPGAAEVLLSDLQTIRTVSVTGEERYDDADRVEPALLQIAASALWDKLPAGTADIAVRDVRWYGSVDSALAAHYGPVIARVADYHDLPPARLYSWLLTAFVTELGTGRGAYEGAAETAGLPNSVAQALADSHLLAPEIRHGTRWYRLLSDRLIMPLRQVHGDRPAPATPAQYLRAAERAVASGDVQAAGRYARATLDTALENDFRLRGEAESLLGNLAFEEAKTNEADSRYRAGADSQYWAGAESRYRAAAEQFEAAGDSPAAARELAAVGQMLIAQDKLPDAVRELRSAVARAPNDPVMLTGLGLALWRLGDGRAAVAVLTAVLGTDGGNPEALRARGEILADLGDARAAMLDLDRVLPLQDRPAARAARALAIAELGDQATATREINNVVSAAPHNGRVLLYAARASALRGDRAGAAYLARCAVDAVDPTLSRPHIKVALEMVGQRHDKP
jgi:tetratricopeptide (TPR) repeat protein